MLKSNEKTIYFVTGASGFIGANLSLKLLEDKNATVHVCARRSSNVWRLENHLSQLQVHYLDLTDFTILNKALASIRPDYIFHCAEASTNNAMFEKHLALHAQAAQISLNLMEASKNCPPKAVVHACSSLVYEQLAPFISELTPFKPFSFKGIVKLKREMKS